MLAGDRGALLTYTGKDVGELDVQVSVVIQTWDCLNG